jgi:hypothetical protein
MFIDQIFVNTGVIAFVYRSLNLNTGGSKILQHVYENSDGWLILYVTGIFLYDEFKSCFRSTLNKRIKLNK